MENQPIDLKWPPSIQLADLHADANVIGMYDLDQ